MFMAFMSKSAHRPWLVAGFVIALLAGLLIAALTR